MPIASIWRGLAKYVEQQSRSGDEILIPHRHLADWWVEALYYSLYYYAPSPTRPMFISSGALSDDEVLVRLQGGHRVWIFAPPRTRSWSNAL